MQETHCINTIESKWRKEWDGNSFWNNGTKAQKGVAVLFKEGFKYNVNVNNTDQNGRYIQCEFKIDTDEIFRITHAGADSRGEAHPARAPHKIGKNMIFLRKFVIFHPKYPQNFRASLRSARFFF